MGSPVISDRRVISSDSEPGEAETTEDSTVCSWPVLARAKSMKSTGIRFSVLKPP